MHFGAGRWGGEPIIVPKTQQHAGASSADPAGAGADLSDDVYILTFIHEEGGGATSTMEVGGTPREMSACSDAYASMDEPYTRHLQLLMLRLPADRNTDADCALASSKSEKAPRVFSANDSSGTSGQTRAAQTPLARDRRP